MIDRRLFPIVLGLVVPGVKAEPLLDQVAEALSFASVDGGWRGQVSGSLEWEGFLLERPVSDLVLSDDDFVNPRLTLWLDAQAGERVYLFGQVRLDRGFDPTNQGDLRPRLDELALRLRLTRGDQLYLQVGQFATVTGHWPRRHGAWENPFITAPLAYDNLLAIWDRAATDSVTTLLNWAHVHPASEAAEVHADRDQRVPIVWGPSYTTGLALLGRSQRFEYAVEVKNAAPSSRPEVWNDDGAQWDHPTISARLGWRPNEMWLTGLSASSGTYLLPEARATLAPGTGWGDYRQLLVAFDAAFAWHHLQVWSEVHLARFEIPRVADVETAAYFIEARYKLTPRLAVAARWNQQLFSEVADLSGRSWPWGRETWRVDVAPAWRFTPHVQLKLQYSLRHETPAPQALTHAAAAQLTVRF